ncbi:MAG: glucosaminidase domain-containing protein [Gammaproteobacteria bacterium]
MRSAAQRGLAPSASVVVFLSFSLVALQTAAAEQHFEFTSYKDVEKLFAELNYTPEAWRAGIRAVPRLYLQEISSRWRDKYTDEISIPTKKRLFFRALAPLALRSNELILADRDRLYSLNESFESFEALSARDQIWLEEIANRYRVLPDDSNIPDRTSLEMLKLRVDIVPLSIALSQSAEESGWGTSRFAAEGNALFGQWSWGKGIKPKQQRTSEHGDYRIASFSTPLDSVVAYTHNLNTGNAYQRLRARRAELRANNQPIRGMDIVDTLDKYSERGTDYVDTLKSIIQFNDLDDADDAYFEGENVWLLIPVDH